MADEYHYDSDLRWTRGEVDALKSLWRGGSSASECAAELFKRFGRFISRSAVLGKINRLGLSAPRSKLESKRAPKTPRSLKTVTRIIRGGNGNAMRVVETPDFSEDISRRELSADDIPLSQRKQLLDMGPRDCRWPYGDPGTPDFFFCGAQRDPDCSYCAEHYRVSRHRVVAISDAERLRRQILGRRMAAQNNSGRLPA